MEEAEERTWLSSPVAILLGLGWLFTGGFVANNMLQFYTYFVIVLGMFNLFCSGYFA